jgi:hypothetical protein
MADETEKLQNMCTEMRDRAEQAGDALVGAADIADEDPQKAMDTVQMQIPLLPQLVDARPMYDTPEEAEEAGDEDSFKDATTAFLDNVATYVVIEPATKAGIVGAS